MFSKCGMNCICQHAGFMFQCEGSCLSMWMFHASLSHVKPSVYPNDPHSRYTTYWNQREWSIETTIVISVFGKPAGNAAVLTRAKSLAYAATQ